MQHKSHSYVVFKFLFVKNLMTWQEPQSIIDDELTHERTLEVQVREQNANRFNTIEKTMGKWSRNDATTMAAV